MVFKELDGHIKQKKRKIFEEYKQRKKNLPAPTIRVSLDRTYLHSVESLKSTEDALRKKRRKAEKSKKCLIDQWKNLTRKEKEFQKLFRFFEKFVISNTEKVSRYAKKYEYLHENKKLKERKIEELKVKIKYFKDVHQTMLNEIFKHMIYQKFLQKFIDEVQIKRIHTVMKRYANLLDSNNDLNISINNVIARGIQYFDDYVNVINNKKSEMLRLVEILTHYTKKSDEINSLVIKLELQVKDVQVQCSEILTNVRTAKTSLYHLLDYQLLRLKSKVPPKTFKGGTTVNERIMYLNKALEILQKMKRILRRTSEDKKLINITEMETSDKDAIPGRSFSVVKVKSSVKLLRKHKKKEKVDLTDKPFPKVSPAVAETLRRLERTIREENKGERGSDRISLAVSIYGSTCTIMRNFKKRKLESMKSKIRTDGSTSTKSSSISYRKKSIKTDATSEVSNTFTYLSLDANPKESFIDESKIGRKKFEKNFKLFEDFQKNPQLDIDSIFEDIKKDKLRLPKLKDRIKKLASQTNKWNDFLNLPKITFTRRHVFENSIDFDEESESKNTEVSKEINFSDVSSEIASTIL